MEKQMRQPQAAKVYERSPTYQRLARFGLHAGRWCITSHRIRMALLCGIEPLA